MDKHKLGIIVPHRNRKEYLRIFVKHMEKYLSEKKIDYVIIVVTQDNDKQFNRGTLLNIGYLYAKSSGCDYIVFHDVDMLPIDVDYSYSDKPLHLATDFIFEEGETKREVFHEYFGGVTLFPIEDFKKINGYSNKYWGWGYEDTELLFRCKYMNLSLDTMRIKNMSKTGARIEFNGVNSYVRGQNIFNLNHNCSFFMSFHASQFVFDHKKDADTYTIFSIPGWDFSVSYNSFLRYSFCAFDNELKPLYSNSEINPSYHTNVFINVDNNEKIISFYQDGKLIGKTENYRKLYFYKKEPFFYLGVGNLNRIDSPNFFKGTINSFAFFDDILNEKAIKEISNNKTKYLTEPFGDYNFDKSLKLYYDSKFIKNYKLIDLSGNENHGEIVNSTIINEVVPEYTEVKIPFRRKSIFKSLKHEENGFFENKWRDQATRWNQLRYHNETLLNPELIKNDGLSDLKFTEHKIKQTNKLTQIFIGL
jgi:hypothetical protein